MKDSTKNPKPITKEAATGSAASVKDASSAPSKNTTLVKKKGAQAGDPTKMAKPSRSATTATGGARYGVSVKMSGGVAPEAGMTQGNGRMFSPAVKRSKPNFTDGMNASYRD